MGDALGMPPAAFVDPGRGEAEPLELCSTALEGEPAIVAEAWVQSPGRDDADYDAADPA